MKYISLYAYASENITYKKSNEKFKWRNRRKIEIERAEGKDRIASQGFCQPGPFLNRQAENKEYYYHYV